MTLAVCPGICNSSESIYIRRVVYHAQFQGFRVAVLNHVGALKNVPVTSPRIFNYGEFYLVDWHSRRAQFIHTKLPQLRSILWYKLSIPSVMLKSWNRAWVWVTLHLLRQE